MDILIKMAYDKKKQIAFQNLYLDSDVRDKFLLRSALVQALKNCPQLIPNNTKDWILCVLSQYNKPEEDTMRVFQGICKYINKQFSFGLLDEKIQWKDSCEIADSCLIGISFFREHFEFLHEYRSAPSVEYYSK